MRLLGRPGRRARVTRSQPPIGVDAIANGTSGCVEIAPEKTNAAITQWREPHLIARNPQVPARNQLFLFFCGSYGIPARQRLITTLAARLGYHAINLSYPNSWTVGGLCRGSQDPDCHGQVRLDVLDGGGRSGLLQIRAAESIENRLRSLLAYLATQAPAQGWECFLDNMGGIDWSSLVIAGHSQGGGQAAIIGKRYRVARVIMLAAPVDHLRTLQCPAAWLSAPGATPSDRYYGFVHQADQGFEHIKRSWELLGMAAQLPARVDGSQPPYGGARRLITEIAPVRRDKFHGCVAVDRLTPMQLDGTPVFEPVWRYLLSDNC